MFPSFATLYKFNVRVANTIMDSDIGCLPLVASDSNNISGLKFSHPMPFAFGIATLILHVFHIVGACSKKQVFRIAAQWNITAMTNKKTVWYSAVSHFPSHTRGNILLFIKTNSPSSIPRYTSFPQPTISCSPNRHIVPQPNPDIW